MTLPEICLTLFAWMKENQSCLVPGGGGGGKRRKDGVEAPQ